MQFDPCSPTLIFGTPPNGWLRCDGWDQEILLSLAVRSSADVEEPMRLSDGGRETPLICLQTHSWTTTDRAPPNTPKAWPVRPPGAQKKYVLWFRANSSTHREMGGAGDPSQITSCLFSGLLQWSWINWRIQTLPSTWTPAAVWIVLDELCPVVLVFLQLKVQKYGTQYKTVHYLVLFLTVKIPVTE